MYYRYYVQVTWTRRTKRPDTGERNLQLLSVGDNTYISDNRFIISNKKVDNVSEDWPRSCCAIISSVDQSSLIDVSLQFQNWELTISRVELSDGGEYLCQASTHPPLAITTHLDVVGRREEKGGRERERGEARILMLLRAFQIIPGKLCYNVTAKVHLKFTKRK